MKQVLMLHGWYQKPSSNWYPWLKRELKHREYHVFLPDLPTAHTDLPDMNKQLRFVERLVTLDKDSMVIGHSLGALLGMRLAEKYSFDKLFLVAGWDYNDLTSGHRLFWKKPIHHAVIKRHVRKIFVISSDNDPYTTAVQSEDMSKRLGGKFILVPGAGHFTQKYGVTTIPSILPYLS